MPMNYSEAEAVGSIYADVIYGIGVFTPEQKKLNSMALRYSPPTTPKLKSNQKL